MKSRFARHSLDFPTPRLLPDRAVEQKREKPLEQATRRCIGRLSQQDFGKGRTNCSAHRSSAVFIHPSIHPSNRTLLQARPPAVAEGWCSLHASSSKTPTITSVLVHAKHALPLVCARSTVTVDPFPIRSDPFSVHSGSIPPPHWRVPSARSLSRQGLVERSDRYIRVVTSD